MHYYSHHLGDYAKDTGHLSLAEHGAYRMLLDHYYSTEKPLPENAVAVARICRATSRQEREAVESVLSQFFTLSDGGYLHKRVERELENNRRLREKNTENGKRGGRPKQTEEKPTGFILGSFSETQTKAYPTTINQQPVLLEKEPKREGEELPGLNGNGKASGKLPTTPAALALAEMFHRRPTTPWSDAEIRLFKRLQPINPEDLEALTAYYASHWPPDRETNVLRHDLKTLLGNFPGEVDRANTWKLRGTNGHKATAQTTESKYGPVQPDKWKLPYAQ